MNRLTGKLPLPAFAVLVGLGGFVLGVLVTSATGIGTRTHTLLAAPLTVTRPSGRPARLPGLRRRRAIAASRRRDQLAISSVLRYTPFITNGTPRRRVIALTFDDGPSPYTSAVVRTLVRMRVHATFFDVGQQLDYFSAGLRTELAHGFVVGDHTENHAWLPPLTRSQQRSQIQLAAARIVRMGASRPRLFRPPYGGYNARTIATLRRLKMLMVLWSIDPSDWRRPGTSAIVANVLGHARPGAIVLMHDGGGDRSQTVAALPQIIRGLRRRHYRLVTVPRLLMLDPPPRHQRLPHLFGDLSPCRQRLVSGILIAPDIRPRHRGGESMSDPINS